MCCALVWSPLTGIYKALRMVREGFNEPLVLNQYETFSLERVKHEIQSQGGWAEVRAASLGRKVPAVVTGGTR